ncbi:hypothetical protein DL762_003468 [Monosporascus cannonballus]|uniref:Peptidase A1 domain-containing protein n=1 Tax=Monosporascus cannonballus TaxID=155416 RepID=A0ABY0HAX6_9PEZI|nr:hypothetical protein DL762_003468 [Monosporascus cannonballus]RYO94653.1 hypothetical protein DL763_004020 [Monosporascus cannonballus]
MPGPQFVQLDTGSFELWVNPECSSLGGLSDRKFCEAVGHYNPSASSTSVQLAGTKTLVYGIGSARIQYVADDIRLSGTDAHLKEVQFGVAMKTKDELTGILGLGHGHGVTLDYKNFVDQLEDQGITDTKAFSLALGGKMEQEGLVIFGGLDTGKFSGTLKTLPIIPAQKSPDGAPRYWVGMNHISLTPPSNRTKRYENTTMAAFLDSGATLTLFPPEIAYAIAADFGAESPDVTGMFPVDCALSTVPGTIDFAFDGITIRVPYSELVREFQTILGETCYLGIGPHEDFVLLGDTMLRSTYAIFDQTNDAIHIAQYANCGTNELEITSKTNLSAMTGDCDLPRFNVPSSAGGSHPTVEATDGSDSTENGGSKGISVSSGSNSLLGLWVALVVVLGDTIG